MCCNLYNKVTNKFFITTSLIQSYCSAWRFQVRIYLLQLLYYALGFFIILDHIFVSLIVINYTIFLGNRFYADTTSMDSEKKNTREWVFSCPNCKKQYAYLSARNKHYATCKQIYNPEGVNSGKLFKCPKCSKSFKIRNSLHRHVKLECGQEPKFSCRLCSYKCYQKVRLQKHAYAKHNYVL